MGGVFGDDSILLANEMYRAVCLAKHFSNEVSQFSARHREWPVRQDMMPSLGQFAVKFFPTTLDVGCHGGAIDCFTAPDHGSGLVRRTPATQLLEDLGEFGGQVIDTREIILLGSWSECLIELNDSTGILILLKKIEAEYCFKKNR